MGLCASRDDDGDDSSAHYIMADGNVHLITTMAAWEEKLMLANQQDKIIIANFSAAWCGPCKIIASYYSELSRKYTSLMFLTIDVDELPDLSTSFDIKATPSFFFLQNGQEIDKLVGSNKVELLKKITAVVDAQGRPF
ncbi:thioredoxin H-type [Spinacia oleracea]|uniref:Thioredoxin H-type n=1 Tax=Spinacia oleracea TaxID=3562 RepID=A0A9R0JES9_SPIOL|nr:thioredoxin H-type-like [Spinacia oleracea]